MQYCKYPILVITSLLCSLCYPQGEVSHTVYITANTGMIENNESISLFDQITKASQKDLSATLLILGNITPTGGYVHEGTARQRVQESLRKNLLEPITGFNGSIVFTPGAHEWNSAAPQSIDDLETFLENNSKAEFWPNDGCPIIEEALSEEVVLITVDSQWFLEDWDHHPEMNRNCDIKTREQLFMEFKNGLKDNHGKTVIVAIHHPVMSNNRIGFFERIGGFSTQAFENPKQQQLRGRLETLASLYEDVIFVSGNHQNLQFLDNERNPQIISGVASKTAPATAKEEGHFASEKRGYAKLTLYKDGSSMVEFFGTKGQLLFSKKIERERARLDEISIVPQEKLGPTKITSIYSSEETQKSELHQWIWGETYRDVYSREIGAPVLYIDSLPGNLRPLKEGGGQQSRSIRFIDDNEHEYTIRALRKSPLKHIQTDMVKESFIGEFLDDTAIERYLADFYTTAHPYAPLAVNGLSEAVDIFSAEPEIYYVPKQETLGIHNEDYGNELYMLEPHVGDENKDFERFGSPDDILSTMDLLLEIRENKDAHVDEDSYIKTRLFDMLIGDWDRDEDQWRWSGFEQENGDKVFYPIPLDRDHAFPRYDGYLVALAKLSIPFLRRMQSFDEDIENIKWFNWSGYPLDNRLINSASWEDWEEQVKFLQENLTDEVIEESFAKLPPEVQDETIENIKANLKHRRENLLEIARSYYDYFKDFETVIGTENDDIFEIRREDNGRTTISITTEGDQHFQNTYNFHATQEIWIYGLGGEDSFFIEGEGAELIKLKIVGGIGHDLYDFSNTKKVKIYDYESRKSTITNPGTNRWFVDSYDINTYDYGKRKYHENKILPFVDFVPDAGFSLGLRNVFTTYGLVRNPFSTQYRLGANYYFATNGYEINYSGEFAHIFYNWNFGIEGRYTSPNYFLNYFGPGNASTYHPESVDNTYNRVKIQQWHAATSLIWHNETGSSFYLKPMLESHQVISEGDDFVSEFFSPENDIFDQQVYGGVELNYNFYNKNNESYPSLGMEFNVFTGYKQNVSAHENRFGYIEPSFSFNYPLVSSGITVIASKIGGQHLFGNEYEFYHAATLGGNDNLRAYRNHRFNGQSSFYHSTDLRSAFALWETRFIPLILGATAGFDYGRVWTENDLLDKWHTSYGGSLWINALYAITGTVGLYHGEDGNRLSFTLNFKY